MRALSTLLFNLSENSMSGDTPSTVIVSDCVPTSSLKSTFTTVLTATWVSRATVLKPGSSALTLYTQIGSSGRLNPPWASVVVVRVKLVAGNVAVTVTPGSTAPVLSTIVPLMSPVVFCASAGATSTTASSQPETNGTPSRTCRISALLSVRTTPSTPTASRAGPRSR